MVICRCELLVLWSEIKFYCDVSAELWNTIGDYKTNNLHTQMTIFNTVIHIQMPPFVFVFLKPCYIASNVRGKTSVYHRQHYGMKLGFLQYIAEYMLSQKFEVKQSDGT